MDVEVTSRSGPARCAVCHDELASPAAPCDGCGTVLHAECREAVHGCPTIGCRNRVVPVVVTESQGDRERARARRLGLVALFNGAAALYMAGVCHLLLGRAPPESTLAASPAALAFGGSVLLGALTLVLAVRSWRRSWFGTAALAMEIAWLILTGPQLVELLAWSRPLTEAEAREYANRIDYGHESVFERIDVDAMLRQGEPFRASLPEDERKAIRVRFREFQAASAQTLAEDGGSVRVLRLTSDARPTVIVRLVDRDGGLTYHEYVLGRGRDGDPTCSAVRDLRLLESWFTMTSHVMRASSRTRHQLKRLVTLVNDDQPEAALRAFRRMGPALKADRGILLTRLRAAQLVGEDEAEALDDVISTTNGDPPILRWELARVRGEDAASLEALDAIDRMVGTDPFLDALRADVQNVEGGSTFALDLAKRATQALPDVEATWWSLLECAVELRDHANTRAALEKLVSTFRNEAQDLEESLDLNEFFNSPEGAAWLARKPGDR